MRAVPLNMQRTEERSVPKGFDFCARGFVGNHPPESSIANSSLQNSAPIGWLRRT
jgi:hypothetical protein